MYFVETIWACSEVEETFIATLQNKRPNTELKFGMEGRMDNVGREVRGVEQTKSLNFDLLTKFSKV